jgi:hypothetical protein
VRLDAAERALKRAGDMPKSVQDYARKAIKRGRFEKGRAFPREDEKKPVKRTTAKKAVTPAVPVKAADAAKAYTKNVLDVLPRKYGDVATMGRPAFDDNYLGLIEPGSETGDPERNGDVRYTNPNYYNGKEWQVNCQRVAVAYELRRRGYLVEAKPNYKDKRSKQYSFEDLRLWHRPDKWLTFDPDTVKFAEVAPNTPGAQLIPGGPALWERPITKDDVLKIVSAWPPGARGWIGGAWNSLSAHIWNIEIADDGRILWIDAQPRIAGKKVESYLDDIQPGTFHVMRVDELEPLDDEMVRMVTPLKP